MAKTNSGGRAPRSATELQQASLIVQYELATLACTHELLQESGTHWGSPARDRALSNALLHAFLLAARNLLTFLYSHNPRPSDIVAEDFFDDRDTWPKSRAVPEPEMANGELIGLISKRLAHLTWDRAASTKPLWGPFRIVWNTGLAMQSFLQAVDAQRVHPHLRADVEATMARLKAQLDQWGGLPAMMAPAQELMEFDQLKDSTPPTTDDA